MVSMSLIALIVGALSIPFAFFGCSGAPVFVSLLFVIAGMVLGALAMMREKDQSGLALVALICSGIGLIITIICFACTGCTVCRYGALANELMRYSS